MVLKTSSRSHDDECVRGGVTDEDFMKKKRFPLDVGKNSDCNKRSEENEEKQI